MELMGTQDGPIVIETPGRHPIYSVSFSRNDKQVMSGGVEGVFRQWRVDDGGEVGQSIRAEGAKIFAADLSADCKWLVCGLRRSEGQRDGKAHAKVWDTQTHKKVLDVPGHKDSVFSVHISPDSTKFATGSADKTAFIWSLTTGEQLVGPLRHEGVVVTVRFSPNGDRIATATAANGPDTKSIRIFDSENGQRLLDVPFPVNIHISSPLAWSPEGCHLFAVSYSKLKCFDTSLGSPLCAWTVPGGGSSASITLSRNQKFIAVAAYKSLSFWDAITHKQIGTAIEHASPVWSITLSFDDEYVATGEQDGKVIFRCLRDVLPGVYIMINVTSHSLLLLCTLPLIYINDTAFRAWAQGDLTRVEELLSEEAVHPFHRARALAQRALVRARLKRWDLAVSDAKESIEVQRSVIGYIATALAHIGNGEHELAMSVFDLVFSVDVPREDRFLLLIKAVILFECGKHCEAMARVDSLIGIVDDRSFYITIRAQMLLILGDMSLSRGDSKQALEFFRRAEGAAPFQNDSHLVIISLIFGWALDQSALTVQRHLHRCIKPFEDNGDVAMQSGNPAEANIQYSTALSLNPPNPAGLFVKRSEARAGLRLWEDALKDADEAINVDPVDPRGYGKRHAVLHGMHRYDEAIDAFTRMLSLIEGSHGQDVRQLGKKYISLPFLVTTIESIARRVFKIYPLVLINVESGRLCNVPERMHIFKSEIRFKQLISSMTEVLDEGRIQRVVEEYFRYVTFSHVWAGEEPLFQVVTSAGSVWNLDSSALNEKLKRFCKTVREDGYQWAWSDTCCIDKTISTVQNRSLAMMYKWYEASTATFVFLGDVEFPSKPGALTGSAWMTRVWTAQELLAPKVVRFYDRNWKPYLGDTRSNHKESPEIMQEITNAIGIARETITTFHPDDLSVREKLRLASTRNATVEEDVAYSLIGIFKSDIRPHYGEGDAALGHLLEEIVARSGDVTAIDWTGKSSPYHSCLPATLAVFSQPPHAPPAIKDAEMVLHITTLKKSLPQLDVMLTYSQVTRLPPARFAHRRLHLPCIIFTVTRLRVRDSESGQENHYRARVPGIGHVDFQTSDPLSLTEPRRLVFAHPWIRDLRDPLDSSSWGRPVGGDDHGSDSETEAGPTPSSSLQAGPTATMDDYTRALRLIVRLCQPFHALLLQQQPNGEFKRIAAEHKIIVPGLDPQIDFARHIRAEVVEVL